MNSMKIELCAASEIAIEIASNYGFDRIELCQQLEIGGITPSVGLQLFAKSRIETHVLIRPRGGNFVFSSAEKEVMLMDIAAVKNNGLSGVVIGALTDENTLDEDWLREACKVAGNLELTFHRAFDEVNDWQSALESLISLGFHRILTSGQASNALLGKALLTQFLAFANKRIEIMAGGGIQVSNIAEIQSEVCPNAIHFSATEWKQIGDGSRYEINALCVSESKVQTLLKAIQR